MIGMIIRRLIVPCVQSEEISLPVDFAIVTLSESLLIDNYVCVTIILQQHTLLYFNNIVLMTSVSVMKELASP